MIFVKESNNQSIDLIQAHGGTLINRMVPQGDLPAALQKAKSYPQIPLTPTQLADIEMIAIGGFSPLEGFLNEEDYVSVQKNMRLAEGTLWPLPIVLPVSEAVKTTLKPGHPAALVFEGEIQAVLHIEDIYKQEQIFVGGKIDVLKVQSHSDFSATNLTPRDTRRIFKDRKWKTVVGFQTRNPIHRAHEYLTKTALELVDGLLIHPVVGQTKADDIPADVRMKCYEAVIKNYYPKERVVLSINPSQMFYAGPREAVLHAIVHQNYGCTHFIVGRDHAGVGNKFGPYEAQDLIKSFNRRELAITPICFENAFWCKKMNAMATNKTTNSREDERINLSGTQVREMLKAGKLPPPEFTRPEVAQILMDSIR